MNHQLDASHSCYLQIIVTGVVEKTGLIKAMSALMSHPDYHDKHSFWNFTGSSSMDLSMEEMKELAGVLRLFKVSNTNFANKSAILVPDHIHQALANIFVSISKWLPFEYKVFQDKDAAINFLIPQK